MTAFNMKARNCIFSDILIVKSKNLQEEKIYKVNANLKPKYTRLICAIIVISLQFF